MKCQDYYSLDKTKIHSLTRKNSPTTRPFYLSKAPGHTNKRQVPEPLAAFRSGIYLSLLNLFSSLPSFFEVSPSYIGLSIIFFSCVSCIWGWLIMGILVLLPRGCNLNAREYSLIALLFFESFALSFSWKIWISLNIFFFGIITAVGRKLDLNITQNVFQFACMKFMHSSISFSFVLNIWVSNLIYRH